MDNKFLVIEVSNFGESAFTMCHSRFDAVHLAESLVEDSSLETIRIVEIATGETWAYAV